MDRYSNYPASVQKLPKVGGGLDPNIEAIVALRPDVVVMSVSSRAGERLEALGVKVVTLEPKTHADVQRVLATMARLLGQPDDAARKVWRVIDAAVSAAAQSLAPEARNTRVYFEVSRGPYGAGESSFIGETLTRLGVKNIVPASLGPFPRLNPEFVVRANPDLIMMGNRSMQSMVPYPGWDTIKAVREQRCACLGLTIRTPWCAPAPHGRGDPADGPVHQRQDGPPRPGRGGPAHERIHHAPSRLPLYPTPALPRRASAQPGCCWA